MRANYDQCLFWILDDEKGYVNHPKDPGGATNYGITQKTYDAYRRDIGEPTRSVKHIERDELEVIYREDYAKRIRFDELDSGVDYAFLHFAVNSGVSRATRYVQRIVAGARPKTV